MYTGVERNRVVKKLSKTRISVSSRKINGTLFIKSLRDAPACNTIYVNIYGRNIAKCRRREKKE